jgi:pimeloyl-ACP methyl ester carboxylesterase
MGLPFIGKKWYRAFRKNPEGAWRSLFFYYRDIEALPDEDKIFLRERVMARVNSANQERGYFASLRSINAMGLFAVSSYTRRVKQYPGKILILWGAEDRVLSAGAPLIIRRLRPDAVYRTINGAGHLPQQERHEETAAAIIEFLGNKAGAG